MITETSSLLAIFGLAVTLSAYLSAIRLIAIQKIQDLPGNDQKTEDKKWDLRKKLGWLTLADVPMVLSAFLLGLFLLWDYLLLDLYEGKWCKWWDQVTSKDLQEWLSFLGLWFFLIAGTVMVILHMVAWWNTAKSLLKGKKIIESEPAKESQPQSASAAIIEANTTTETPATEIKPPPEKP
ncbi:hypothetical protein [Gimesia maris]|uniref:Uncharacterized protein n=1 Tax=Gimesia maris TaxID=122 RepID=A0ABX5YGB5_9PLAN|nr:hypothetical protein [Gimesia maris]EDL56634.1 hypothetical protein PM8797T_06672 [Gimesia maris DSM 8797]QEG14665.1 hypothetical protein GmarT_05010 [Gimesia maris]QGQ31934.1 hypothetical protein F1729_26680 [Gimesia maris]|tara:strand:+ start:22889 stop:23431 length:543 start_codon:yes stop_codon:yes gene_type:complete